MKMAKADDKEWESLVAWFNDREAKNKAVPQWRRVVFGFRVLVDNCCDPDKTTLEWKPELAAKLGIET